MTQLNRYATARTRAERHADFLDLINTNFHACGLRYPIQQASRLAGEYLESPTGYEPDPSGTDELRNEIARYYADHDIHVGPDQIVVTASASESYGHIFTGLCEPGDRVLLPRPSYPLFQDVAERCGLEVRFYDQHFSRGWHIDPDEIESIMEPRTRVVVLISPNNPTGHVIPTATLSRLCGTCRDRNILMVMDEVFSEYAGESSLPRPATYGDCDVLTLNGASKLLAAPDLKVSWVLASGPDRKGLVERLQVENDLYLNSSPLSQTIVAGMLKIRQTFVPNLADSVRHRRELMTHLLSEATDLRMVPPTGGIHLPVFLPETLRRQGWDDESMAVQLLDHAHLATHPGYLYGITDDDALVLSSLSPTETIQAGVMRLAAELNRLAGHDPV